MTAIADPDSRVRRNVRVLTLAQAFLGAQMPVHFVLGGLAGQTLAVNKCLATLPISMIVFGSMATAPWLAAFMQRRGRRSGFVLGCLAGALGAALCALALVRGSFGLFLLGSAFVGVYMCGNGFYRFAAADGASPERRPRAIATVMAAGLVAALLGPEIVKLTESALAPVPFAGAYVAVVALNLVGVFLFAFLQSPPPAAPAAGAPPARSRLDLLRTPRFGVAVLVGAVSYALMNLMMTATPLAIVGCGFGTSDAANVVGAHVVAMFAPAFFVGRLIDRFGAVAISATGLLALAAASLAGLAGVELADFYLALVLLGVGWSFGFIGATTMLTASYRPEERGRAQGLNDFIVFGTVGLTSLASGGLMNCAGGDPVAGWTSVALAMLPLIVFALAALLWLSVRDRPARA